MENHAYKQSEKCYEKINQTSLTCTNIFLKSFFNLQLTIRLYYNWQLHEGPLICNMLMLTIGIYVHTNANGILLTFNHKISEEKKCYIYNHMIIYFL